MGRSRVSNQMRTRSKSKKNNKGFNLEDPDFEIPILSPAQLEEEFFGLLSEKAIATILNKSPKDIPTLLSAARKGEAYFRACLGFPANPAPPEIALFAPPTEDEVTEPDQTAKDLQHAISTESQSGLVDVVLKLHMDSRKFAGPEFESLENSLESNSFIDSSGLSASNELAIVPSNFDFEEFAIRNKASGDLTFPISTATKDLTITPACSVDTTFGKNGEVTEDDAPVASSLELEDNDTHVDDGVAALLAPSTSKPATNNTVGEVLELVIPSVDIGDKDPREEQHQGKAPGPDQLRGRKFVPKQGNRKITNDLRIRKDPSLPKHVYKIPAEELADVEVEWNATLMGVLAGAPISLHMMSDFAASEWEVPLPKIFAKDNGIWVFKFKSDQDCLWVLENGPWLIGGSRPLILRTWQTGEAIDWTSFKSVPVWTKIVDIDPLLLSSNRMIEVIGNMIGSPISMDCITKEVEKISYARLLVEVTPEELKREEVVLESYNGIIYRHKVEFEWTPWSCDICNVFGHSTHYCKSRKIPHVATKSQEGTQIWKQKTFKSVVQGHSTVQKGDITAEQSQVAQKVMINPNNGQRRDNSGAHKSQKPLPNEGKGILNTPSTKEKVAVHSLQTLPAKETPGPSIPRQDKKARQTVDGWVSTPGHVSRRFYPPREGASKSEKDGRDTNSFGALTDSNKSARPPDPSKKVGP